MQHRLGYTYVWPLSARIIHWTIALSFIASFATAFHHRFFTIHIAFGYLFALSLFFRLVWGFIGPNYATFRTFSLSLNALKRYFQDKIENRWRKIHPGHNAASSWFTLLVLFCGLLISLSGLLLYGTLEGSGPFGLLNQESYRTSYVWEQWHTWLSFLLLGCAIVHVTGVLIEQFYHKTHMLFAMITGYKSCEGEDAKVSTLQHFLTYGAIVVHAALFLVILHEEESLLTKSVFTKWEYAKEAPVYAKACGECHKPYPPFMLPKTSWEKLIAGLHNHFGEEITDANISKNDQAGILSYLTHNSAEHSSHKLAFRTLDSLGDIRPLSITKSPYWREAHAHLPASLFKEPQIKDRSNCFACHLNFEYGLLDNRWIALP